MVIADKLGVALALSHRTATVSPELLARAVIGLVDAGLGQSLIEPDALGPTTLLDTFIAPLTRQLSVPDDDAGHRTPVCEKAEGSSRDLATDQSAEAAAVGGVDSDVGFRMLAVAEAAFLRDGYAKARLSDIAATAGMSKKTIYAYAPSKSELFAAVVRQAIDREFGPDHLDPLSDGDLMTALSSYLTRYARRCFSDTAVRLYG